MMDKNWSIENFKRLFLSNNHDLEMFSLISRNNFFRTIMTLVAHYDLELQQMDVKTVFLNEDSLGGVERVVVDEDQILKRSKVRRYLEGLIQIGTWT